MRFGSVCSGIEAASVAWEPLGWTAAWLSEIEPFPAAVLAHHWPQVKNLGDMTLIRDRVAAGEIEAPDVLVGGTPCQAFSVAGLRNSLDDDRGKLTLEFVRLADEIDNIRTAVGLDKSIIVWENVPGVLNTKDNAFGCFLGALAGEDCELQPAGKKWTNAGCVFGPERAVAWRVIDAQYFGVAQRRRRVFVVASARAGFDPTKILFESEGVRRDSAPRREAVQSTAASAARSIALRDRDGGATAELGDNTSTCLRAGSGGEDRPHVLTVHGTQDPCVSDKAFAIGRNSGQENAVCTPAIGWSEELTAHIELQGTIQRGGDGGRHEGVMQPDMSVRRLTPVECERLQGFPDNHTQIPWRKKPADQCPDGPRYKALGNSMAVPVMRWIGKRIAEAIK